MREVCFLIAGDAVLRAYFGRSTAIPDSPARWEDIWRHRDRIDEIVHTHPGDLLDFSEEDLTTMEAVEAATGRSFAWSILTTSGYIRRIGLDGADDRPVQAPWWAGMLRELSFGQGTHIWNQEAAEHRPKER